MRAILLFIIILLICFNTYSQDKVVKKETQTSYNVSKSGKLTPDGTIIEKHYNMSGKVILESNKSFWPEVNKEVSYIKKYFYTNEKILDSVHVFEGEKLLLKVEYQHDSSGLEIGATEILPGGQKSFSAKYSYNNKLQKVKEQLFSRDGILFTVKEYFYDSSGNLIEERGYDRGTPKYKYVYKYDKNMFLIERKQYDNKNKLVKQTKYKNNKQGLPLEFKETTFAGKDKTVKIVKFSYEYH